MSDQEQIVTAADVMESDVLPKARVVHTDPNSPQTAEQKPLPTAMAKKSVEQKSPAEWAYERLVLYIKNFEEQLDNAHEIAIGMAGSEGGALRIEGIGYFDPDIITFYGSSPTGAKTQLIQHVSQLNVMLHAMPKLIEEDEPKRIGFRLEAELNEG